MHPLQELWDKLISRLFCLRDAFGGPSKARLYLEESLAANEYELALHTLCDYLLEQHPITISTNLIGAISELHTMMNLKDDCEDALTRKLSR